jgi:hypothetical protein
LNRTLGGKVKKTDIFKAAGIKSKRTGYRILVKGTARRSQRLHNRGRKRILSDHVLDAIEKVEDSSFAWATSSHANVARSLGQTEAKERTIQQNMSDRGIKTYVAAQAKFLSQANMDARVEYCKPRQD